MSVLERMGFKIVNIVARVIVVAEIKETNVAVVLDLKIVYSWFSESFFLNAGNAIIMKMYGKQNVNVR